MTVSPAATVVDADPPATLTRTVTARLVMMVHEAPKVMLQIAPSGFEAGQLAESLTVTCDHEPLDVTEVVTDAASRVHVFRARPGLTVVEYRATITGRALPMRPSLADEIVFLRPSRYAESDRLGAFAHAQFGDVGGPQERVAAVASWINANVGYVIGSSRPMDSAIDTLLLRQGVCRDYAHLLIGTLRALDIPARLAAVYAPGLTPMDFHAVAEVAVGGRWLVVDPTGLAPRSSMVRIATGADAAETAFVSAYGGALDFWETQVSATIDGDLPVEDSAEAYVLT